MALNSDAWSLAQHRHFRPPAPFEPRECARPAHGIAAHALCDGARASAALTASDQSNPPCESAVSSKLPWHPRGLKPGVPQGSWSVVRFRIFHEIGKRPRDPETSANRRRSTKPIFRILRMFRLWSTMQEPHLSKRRSPYVHP